MHLERLHRQLVGDRPLSLTAGSYICHVSSFGRGLKLQWQPVTVPSSSDQELFPHTVILPDGLPTVSSRCSRCSRVAAVAAVESLQ